MSVCPSVRPMAENREFQVSGSSEFVRSIFKSIFFFVDYIFSVYFFFSVHSIFCPSIEICFCTNSPIVLLLGLLSSLRENLVQIDVLLFLVHGQVGPGSWRVVGVVPHDVVVVRR